MQMPLRPSSSYYVASCCIGALLALSYLSYAPDIISGDGAALDGSYTLSALSTASKGDAVRAASFIAVLIVAALAVLKARGVSALMGVPRNLLFVLAWCWLSTTWSIEPDVAVRRIAFTTILVLTISWSVQLLTFEAVVRCLVLALSLLVLADWAAVIVFPLAVHPVTALDPSLVGDWRGLQNHKNEAGAMCAVALIVFTNEAFRLRSYVSGLLMILAAAAFLYETHSKTSGAMALAAIAFGVATQVGYARPFARNTALLILVAISILTLSLYGEQIFSLLAGLLDDPGALTGRTQIWPVLLSFAADHPFLGAGYGSFFAIGSASPIFQYGSGWVTTVDHAHNGYIDLLVQIGGVGLGLVMWTLVLRPFYLLIFAPIRQPGARYLLTAVFTFACLHDLLETSLLDRDASTWIILLIMYCLLEALVVNKARNSAPQQVPASLISHSGLAP